MPPLTRGVGEVGVRAGLQGEDLGLATVVGHGRGGEGEGGSGAARRMRVGTLLCILRLHGGKENKLRQVHSGPVESLAVIQG